MNKLFIVAGEASADLHGAGMLQELQQLNPSVQCAGIGGEALIAQGMAVWAKASSLNVVGISDWSEKIGEVWRTYFDVIRRLKKWKPDCAILMDLPDFNLRIAKILKNLGVPVVYYISPQVWAWRKYRVRKIRRRVDKMLVVFPFERDFYAEHAVQVEFVGHPLLETIATRSEYRTRQEILSEPRITLLPGSRKSEIRFHTPMVTAIVAQLRERYPKVQIQIPVASTLRVEQFQLPGWVDFVSDSRAAMRWADAALVASGTATLECALVGTPFSIFYKVSRSSKWLYNLLVRTPFIGMPNLLLGREAVREFFQEKATAKTLVEQCVRCLEDEPCRAQMIADFILTREKLQRGGAAVRVATIVHETLCGKPMVPSGVSLVPSVA